LIRHPLMIAPIAAQWQALLAERLLLNTLGADLKTGRTTP
jgi:hypothetical protein